jgi:hypothetical protein
LARKGKSQRTLTRGGVTSVASCLSTWAQKEDNPALRDVFAKSLELHRMWAEAQVAFLQELKVYRSAFDGILGWLRVVVTPRGRVTF